MAWATVQSNTNANNGISSLTLQMTTANLTAGNLQVLQVYTRGTNLRVSDNQSQIYTLRSTAKTANGIFYVYTCPVLSPGTKPIVTINITGSTFITGIIAEFSGLDTSMGNVDVSLCAAGNSATPSVGPTSNARFDQGLGLMCGNTDGGQTFTNDAGNGFTQVAAVAASGGVAIAGCMSSKTVTIGTTFTGTALQGLSDSYAIAAIVFKLSGDGTVSKKLNNAGLRPHPFSPGLAR